MSETEFMFWLKGVLDSVGNGVMTNEQINMIRNKMEEVTSKLPSPTQNAKWSENEWCKTNHYPIEPLKTVITC